MIRNYSFEIVEFAVFCIENLAAALHTDARTVYRMLCDQSDILKGYIIPEYESLHTQIAFRSGAALACLHFEGSEKI